MARTLETEKTTSGFGSKVAKYFSENVMDSLPESGVVPADLLKIKQTRRSYRINHNQLNCLQDQVNWSNVFL
ncbi:hypothetical protein J6590_037076 [Homalodisca vitripennis]|nr:hypothetical protein J6590_037076 [Homalodisca vitripennis]